MTPAVESTSVPAWAIAPTRPGADLSGRYWTIVAFDDGLTADVVTGWTAQIAARHPQARPRVHLVSDDAAARQAITADLATAVVGWRLMIAGPADACLRLRALATRHRVGDDEITVATTTVDHRDVHCAHCRAMTRTAVQLGGVVRCIGCHRDLDVHQHVSRRLGAHLGVLADLADEPSR